MTHHAWNESTDVRCNSLVGTGHLDKAAIISIAGDSVWATSSGFTVRLHPRRHIAYGVRTEG